MNNFKTNLNFLQRLYLTIFKDMLLFFCNVPSQDSNQNLETNILKIRLRVNLVQLILDHAHNSSGGKEDKTKVIFKTFKKPPKQKSQVNNFLKISVLEMEELFIHATEPLGLTEIYYQASTTVLGTDDKKLNNT